MISKSRIIWTLILMILVTAFYYTKQLKDQEKIEAKAKREIEQTALKNRFLKGPYVANESELSEYETAKTIIYPGKSEFGNHYDEMYDSTCLVYVNSSLKQSKMNCTGIMFDKPSNESDQYPDEADLRYGKYE